jgi:holo-[acyl-carrier protein] synthase
MKALGAGLGQVALAEIEVIHAEEGQPALRLYGRAAEQAERQGLHSWAVSLAHDGGMALAFVVALRTPLA